MITLGYDEEERYVTFLIDQACDEPSVEEDDTFRGEQDWGEGAERPTDEVKIRAVRVETKEAWYAYGDEVTMARAHAEAEVVELNKRYGPEIVYTVVGPYEGVS